MWFELGHHIVWYIHDYKCFGGVFLVCLQRPPDDKSSRSRPNRPFCPFRLHGPITERTTILNLNVIHFSCIVTLLQKTCYTRQVIHNLAILRHYTLIRAEMYRRKYNEKNITSSVYDCTVEDVENRRTYATSMLGRANVI